MTKKLIFSAALLAAFLAAAPISAEASETPATAPDTGIPFANDVNLLDGYNRLDWTGDELYFDSDSTAIFFRRPADIAEKSAYTTSISHDITQLGATGFYFFIDAGTGPSDDLGSCTLSFTDADGTELYSISSGLITKLDNYSRYAVGSETKFYPIPDTAATVTITLNAQQENTDDLVDVYFRNLNLVTSSAKPLMLPIDNQFMDTTSGLSKVEIGNNSLTRWIWVGLIFTVAMIFYVIRMKKQKYKAPELIKPKKTFEK